MSPDDLKSYTAMVSDSLDALKNIHYMTSVTAQASEAVTHGVKTSDEIEARIREAGAQAASEK
jgi:hypothetical protein